MKRFNKSVVVALAIGVLAAGLSGCQKEEGPAERAGKSLDNAVEKAGKKIEEAGEKIQDAANEGKK